MITMQRRCPGGALTPRGWPTGWSRRGEIYLRCARLRQTRSRERSLSWPSRPRQAPRRSPGPHTCWIWIASINKWGYGKFGLGARRGHAVVGAHRVSWEIANGPVPDGLFVCHECDTPPCVNPGHLFLGTPRENSEDMAAKSRHPRDVPYVYAESHGNRKLTLAKVAEIRARHAQGVSASELARIYGVSNVAVSRITRGVAWVVDPDAATEAAQEWAAVTPRWDWIAVREAAVQAHHAQITG